MAAPTMFPFFKAKQSGHINVMAISLQTPFNWSAFV